MSVTSQRRPLSRQRVVDAAVTLADQQGLDALTLRRLAEVLGVHPTSIYNHLPSKESILDAVAARLLEEAELATNYDSWQDWVHAFAKHMRRTAGCHPGAFSVFTRRPPPGSNAHIEAALDAFRRGGFDVQIAHAAMAGTALAVMGMALNEAPGPGPAPVAVGPQVTAESYPRIAEALTQPFTDTSTMWSVVIESLIAGLASRLIS